MTPHGLGLLLESGMVVGDDELHAVEPPVAGRGLVLSPSRTLDSTVHAVRIWRRPSPLIPIAMKTACVWSGDLDRRSIRATPSSRPRLSYRASSQTRAPRPTALGKAPEQSIQALVDPATPTVLAENRASDATSARYRPRGGPVRYRGDASSQRSTVNRVQGRPRSRRLSCVQRAICRTLDPSHHLY